MKVVSFSIWGNDLIYSKGVLANIPLVHKWYSDFSVRVFCGHDVDDQVVNTLKDAGAQVITVKYNLEAHPWIGLFWRFEPLDGDEVVLVRDADSRVTSREVAAVNEWLLSEYSFHCMRDHIEHNVPILGGMFGFRGKSINIMKSALSMGIKNIPSVKGYDQSFLSRFVWPKVADDVMVHDKYHTGISIGDYNYRPLDPNDYFGPHHIRDFPEHEPMEFGTYVGEIIRLGQNL